MKNLVIHTCMVGQVSTNCYLAVNSQTKELFIVDPGDQEEELIEAVIATCAVPRAILLTHGHFDHILAVEPLKTRFDLPVYACVAEKDLLMDPERNMTAAYASALKLNPDFYLKDGETYTAAGFIIRCLHTPGHTPGSCCYELPEEQVLFSGDTLFRGSVGRTDFPGGSMTQIIESIHRLVRELPAETDVYPGHDRPTTIGLETRYNPFV